MKRKNQEQHGNTEPNASIPCVPEMEQAVLGALMIEKDAYSEVGEILNQNLFYEYRHQLIYAAIVNLAAQGKPIDILTVADQLKVTGDIKNAGNPEYIVELTNKVASTKHIKYHAKIIAQKYTARQLLALATDIRIKASDEAQDTEDLISEIRGKLSDISLLNVGKSCTQINPVIDEAYRLIQKNAARTDGLSGLESGFTKLDKLTSGWLNSDLIIIGARTSMGKTAFVLSMIKNMTTNFRTPVALFSLEMSSVQIVNRLMTNVCEISSDKIKSGQLASYEWQQLDYKLKGLYDVPLYVDDSAYMKIDYLCNKARYLVREKGVKLIAIDYIQLLYNEIKYAESRYPDMNYFTRRLKSLAKELNIPIIVVSQMNRNSESREGIDGKRPQLTDLRDSGTLCDEADMVIFIHRPEYYKIFQDNRGNDLHGMAEVIIAKHRNGAQGEVLLRFDSEFTRFSNPEEDIIIPTPDGTRLNFPGSVPPPPENFKSDNPFGFRNDGPLPF